MRVQFWRDFLGNSPSIPTLYGLHEPRPSLEKDDEQGGLLHPALTPEIGQRPPYSHPIILEAARYVMFTYEEVRKRTAGFILTVYGTAPNAEPYPPQGSGYRTLLP